MRKKLILNEGVYDFYDLYEPDSKSPTTDKIVDYYIDKIRKYGQNSLTSEEQRIFKDAQKGKLTLEKPVYKKDKVTGDIELDPVTNIPIRIDIETLTPGVPFITSKGKGAEKKVIINGRCYWDIDENHKTFYVYGGEISETNPQGLVVWKTVSSSGKPLGAFIVPKGESNLTPADLWKNLNNKFDKGIILDKETYLTFLEFDKLFHTSRKENADRLDRLYNILKNYPSSK